MSKHTPGPWRLDDGYLVPRDGLLVGRLYCGPEFCDEINANATLVAAAPDLKDGCNALLGLIQLVCARDDMPPAIREALETSHRIAEARAAIAKAEGRT
jgi:hypothetical protein